LRLGAFLPHLPASTLVNTAVALEASSSAIFWLGGSPWQVPDYDNADTFVDWLVHAGLLFHEPLVDAVLQAQRQDLSVSAIQRRFLRATGVTQATARQIERARYATLILPVVCGLGIFTLLKPIQL
jgi:hypothetical protein